MGVPQNPSQHSTPDSLYELIGIIICHASGRCIFEAIRRHWVWPTAFGRGHISPGIRSPEKQKCETTPKVKRKRESSLSRDHSWRIAAWVVLRAPCFPNCTLFEEVGSAFNFPLQSHARLWSYRKPWYLFICLVRHNTYLLKTYLSWLMTWFFPFNTVQWQV